MIQFLQRLFGGGGQSRVLTDSLQGTGTFSVKVVGDTDDAHQLDLIWEATSNQWQRQEAPEGDYFEHPTDAKLVSEAAKRNDRFAVGVEISGRKVGSINRADSVRIRRRLNQLGYDRLDSSCKAVITGYPEYWEVKLDIAENLINQASSQAPSESPAAES